MRLKIIVVDANVILSALMGGKARTIFSNDSYLFITTRFTLEEVLKYTNLVARKSGESPRYVIKAISLLPLIVLDKEEYIEQRIKATKLMNNIDPKDIDILALALKLNTYLWTEDKHFDSLENDIKLLKTKDLI